MAIRASGFYNNPAFAQAASNLLQFFQPVSGSDAAGYATAEAKRAEAERLKTVMDVAVNEGTSRETLDRHLLGAGMISPTQSFYSVDQDNAAKRYGYDTAASTSRANNAADNARALDQTRLTTLGSFFDPLSQGQVRPAVPSDIAGMYGVDRALPAEAGAPKPLTESEFNALILGGLPADEQRAAALGTTPVENIVTPEGPRTVFRADAVGQQPYFAPGSEAKPTNGMALLADGTRIPAVQIDGKWYSAQDQKLLPTDVQIFDMPKPTGTADELGMGTKTNLTQAQQLVATVENTASLVQELETLVQNNPAATGLAGDLRSFGQDVQQVVREFSASFGDTNAILAPSDIDALTRRLTGGATGYNPVYRQARALLLELAYANAKMNNPSGEVSRFALEREMENLGQGLVGNDKGVLAVIDIAKGRMQRALSQAEVLRGTRDAPTADDPRLQRTAAPTAVEVWTKGADGRPVRSQ